MDLSNLQKEILIGILLGDGNLQSNVNGTTYRLRCIQGELNKEYLFHLYDQFHLFVRTKPKKLNEISGTKIYTKYYFNTISLDIFHYYGELFYNGKVKIIPSNIYDLLTPCSLAYWFMDDGALKWKNKSNGLVLCTDSFTLKEVELLCNVLSRKFNLIVTIQKNGNAYRIYISSKSYEVFKSLVFPYMYPTMLYKLNIKIS